MKNQKGFSLMEMVIVAVVIGLMAALAVPSFLNYTSKLQAKSTARDVVSVLRLARSRAIAERVQYGVYFNAGARQYTFFKDVANPTSFLYEPLAGDSTISQVDLDQDVNYGTNTLTSTTVVFTTAGAASTSGYLRILPASGGDTYNIDVLASTGRIKLTAI